MSKSLMDLDKMNKKPVWYSFSWQVWFSLNSSRHFTNMAAYQITPLRTFRQRHIVLWRSVVAKWAVFLTQQMPVQNGMTKYRLVSKQGDSKSKWPLHTGQERGQRLTFSASQQNKVHKTSIHRQTLQKHWAVGRDRRSTMVLHNHTTSGPAVMAKNTKTTRLAVWGRWPALAAHS